VFSTDLLEKLPHQQGEQTELCGSTLIGPAAGFGFPFQKANKFEWHR
jgi:hypothetical protein